MGNLNHHHYLRNFRFIFFFTFFFFGFIFFFVCDIFFKVFLGFGFFFFLLSIVSFFFLYCCYLVLFPSPGIPNCTVYRLCYESYGHVYVISSFGSSSYNFQHVITVIVKFTLYSYLTCLAVTIYRKDHRKTQVFVSVCLTCLSTTPPPLSPLSCHHHEGVRAGGVVVCHAWWCLCRVLQELS